MKKIICEIQKFKPHFIDTFEEWDIIIDILELFKNFCVKNKLKDDEIEWSNYVIKIHLKDLLNVSDAKTFNEYKDYLLDVKKYLINEAVLEEEYIVAHNLTQICI